MSVEIETRWVTPIERPQDADETCAYVVSKDSYFEVLVTLYGELQATCRWRKENHEFEDLLRRPYDLVCWVISSVGMDVGDQVDTALGEGDLTLNDLPVELPAERSEPVLSSCDDKTMPACTPLR